MDKRFQVNVGAVRSSRQYAWLLLLVLALLSGACNKDDEDNRPVIPYILTYTVTTVGDVEIDAITYTDAGGMERTVVQRELQQTINVSSGFRARLNVRGRFLNGGTFLSLSAQGRGAKPVDLRRDDGSPGTPKPFDLTLETTLP